MPAEKAPVSAHRPLILSAVLAILAMISIEATIVSTAMPNVAGQLGGLQLYSWVFSSFLLSQTASTLVFGKLADLYGRRTVLLNGIAIFLVGSVLCGFAWSMPSLIAFRLVQGLGAGAVVPVAMTVIGDMYPMKERGRVQGWISTVWGVSSVVGPIIGTVIVQHFNWAWIFWINVPIGIAAAAGFFFFMSEAKVEKERSVDILGAALLAIAVAAMMVAISGPGSDHRTVITATLVFITAFFLLLRQERRARDPIINFALWTNRAVAATNMTTMFCCMAVIGLTAFLPMYAQVVMGQSPLIAGFMLTSMLLGWPIAAMVAARGFVRFGLQPIIVAGAALLTIGSLVFVFLSPNSSPFLGCVGSFVMGWGMGFVGTAGLVLIQEAVGWNERGAATASSMFSRNLGNTLGAAVLGAVLNASLSYSQGGSMKGTSYMLGHENLSAGALSAGPHLAQGLHITFCGLFVISLAALMSSVFIPKTAAVKGP